LEIVFVVGVSEFVGCVFGLWELFLLGVWVMQRLHTNSLPLCLCRNGTNCRECFYDVLLMTSTLRPLPREFDIPLRRFHYLRFRRMPLDDPRNRREIRLPDQASVLRDSRLALIGIRLGGAVVVDVPRGCG